MWSVHQVTDPNTTIGVAWGELLPLSWMIPLLWGWTHPLAVPPGYVAQPFTTTELPGSQVLKHNTSYIWYPSLSPLHIIPPSPSPVTQNNFWMKKIVHAWKCLQNIWAVHGNAMTQAQSLIGWGKFGTKSFWCQILFGPSSLARALTDQTARCTQFPWQMSCLAYLFSTSNI